MMIRVGHGMRSPSEANSGANFGITNVVSTPSATAMTIITMIG